VKPTLNLTLDFDKKAYGFNAKKVNSPHEAGDLVFW